MFYIWKKIILKKQKNYWIDWLYFLISTNLIINWLVRCVFHLVSRDPVRIKYYFFSFAFELPFCFAVRHFILSSAILHIGICTHLSFIFASRVVIIFADCSSLECECILRFILLLYSFQDYLYIHIYYYGSRTTI